MINRLMHKLGYVKASVIPKIIGNYITSSPFSFGIADKTYYEMVQKYTSWVYTCVDKISKAVASAPLQLFVYRKGKQKMSDPNFRQMVKALASREQSSWERNLVYKQYGVERQEITDHVFLDLMHKPNDLMSRFTLWYETMIRMEIWACYWYLPKNGLGLPGEIWPLPLTASATIAPKIAPNLKVAYYEYRDGSVNEKFPPDEILPLKYSHPGSIFKAMPPLLAQQYPYDIDQFLMQQQKSLYKNMAVPGLHLHTDEPLEPEQVKEIKKQIDEQMGGALKSGESLVTHSGFKADRLAVTPKEAMLNEVNKFVREKLITAYDLSEGKIGLVRDVNRANIEALDVTFIRECLRPKCMLIEEMIETFLLPRWDTGLTCDFLLPDTADREFELQAAESRLKSQQSCVNEERERKGLDTVAWGDRPIVSAGVAPLLYELQPAKPQKPSATATPPTPPPPAKLGEYTSVHLSDWTEERKDIYWSLMMDARGGLEKVFALRAKAYFRTSGEGVIARLERDGLRIEGQYNGWSSSKIDNHLARNAKALDDINVDQEKEIERLILIFTSMYNEIFAKIGSMRMRELNSGMLFNANDPEVLKWLGVRLEEFSREVADVSFRKIRGVLREGFREGAPTPTIAANLREMFQSWEKYRADLMARTEVMGASNKADLEAARQAGMLGILLKHWLSARDNKCRATHLEADLKYRMGVPLDVLFEVGHDSMDAPGCGSDPSENVNCRCILFYTEAK